MASFPDATPSPSGDGHGPDAPRPTSRSVSVPDPAAPDALRPEPDATASAQTSSPAGSPAAGRQGGAGSQNIDKIRDILFGRQMEDYEARFAQLEARIAGEMDTLRGELRRRFETLESFVKDEVASLDRRLAQEHTARAEADDTLAGALHARHDALAKRIGEYRDAAAAAERDLRQQLLQQATRAADDLRAQTTQTQRTLQQHVADLSNRKTDRAALAALFSELAFRISDDDEAA